ncbi:Cyclin-dependent kinases regulatory subunit (Cell division control protein cks1) [Borealophlyctis nickersoniae]|nr:Cyclin-dependent kinases regulatory subunit (Cell division control protein cks1) [Borealophlyctis nickersoniae]
MLGNPRVDRRGSKVSARKGKPGKSSRVKELPFDPSDNKENVPPEDDENGENLPEEGYLFNPARGGHAGKDSGDGGPQEQDQEEKDYQNEFFDEETGELVSDSKYVRKQQSKQPRNSRKREYDAANYQDADAISSRDGNAQEDDEDYLGDGETEDPRPRSDRSARKKRRKEKKEEGEDIEKHDEWEGVGIEKEDGDAEKQVDGQQQAKKERHMTEEQKKVQAQDHILYSVAKRLLAYYEVHQHQSRHPSKSTVDNVLWLLDQVYYSERYTDDKYEYRHVILPKELLRFIPRPMLGRLLTEDEWRSIGIMQSAGWVHYMCHAPEPNVFVFQREKNYQQKYTHPEDQGDAADQENNQEDDDGVPTDQDEADDVAENEAEEPEADGEAEVDAWDQDAVAEEDDVEGTELSQVVIEEEEEKEQRGRRKSNSKRPRTSDVSRSKSRAPSQRRERALVTRSSSRSNGGVTTRSGGGSASRSASRSSTTKSKPSRSASRGSGAIRDDDEQQPTLRSTSRGRTTRNVSRSGGKGAGGDDEGRMRRRKSEMGEDETGGEGMRRSSRRKN